MSADHLSEAILLLEELGRFLTVSGSRAKPTDIVAALFRFRRALGAVAALADGPARVPDDPERRWGWSQLMSVAALSLREIEECERRYGLTV